MNPETIKYGGKVSPRNYFARIVRDPFQDDPFNEPPGPMTILDKSIAEEIAADDAAAAEVSKCESIAALFFPSTLEECRALCLGLLALLILFIASLCEKAP